MIPFILLAIGLFLIFVEFYLPGGIIGVLGGLVILASILSFAIHYENPWLILLFVIGIGILIYYLFQYTLWRIKTAPPQRSVYSFGDQEGFAASTFDKQAIGKIGVVDTDLKPGGHIIVEGKRHQAISLSGYIARGTEVEVVGGEGESLKVKHIKGK